MNIKITLIFVFILTGCYIQQIYSSCHWREADLCLATLAVYGNVYGIIPTNDKDMAAMCRYLKELQDCAGDFFRRCMKNGTFHTGYALVQSTQLFQNKFCTKGSDVQKEWLKGASCMATHFNKTKPCIEYAVAGLENLENTNPKKRFPTICCVFNNIMQCIIDVVAKNCETNAESMVRMMMKNTLSDVPIMVCRQFDSKSKQCLDVLPPPGTKSKGKDSDSTLVQLLGEFFAF